MSTLQDKLAAAALQEGLVDKSLANPEVISTDEGFPDESPVETLAHSITHRPGGYTILRNNMIVRANGSKMVAENGRYYPVTEEEVALIEHFRKLGYLAKA